MNDNNIDDISNTPRVIHPGWNQADSPTPRPRLPDPDPNLTRSSINLPLPRTIISAMSYFIGLIFVCVWVGTFFPTYLLLAIGVSMVITGVLLGYE